MAEFIPVEAFNLIIFGGTGDLAKRKLLPALYHRWKDGQIPPESRLIGVARTEISKSDYIALAYTACRNATHETNWDKDAWESFTALLDYQPLDAVAEDADWSGLSSKLNADLDLNVYYLSTAPRLYVDIAAALHCAELVTPSSRLVLEKPIGSDLSSAREINEGVCTYFEEHQIYRIDHYLGKESVQNLLVLRFGNHLLEQAWNRDSIDHVQISVAEDIGLEGRGGYYDRSGALRDMVQNHLLQLLCLTAMEAPATLSGDDVREEKIKVLRSLQSITPESVGRNTVRGQYTEGALKGAVVPGYQDELEGDIISSTETFVAIKANIENWRWAGVPFYLRTGKRMASRRSEIVIAFKAVPHSIFGMKGIQANRLVIRLQPDEGVHLYIQIKEPGPGGLLIKSLPLNLSYAENFVIRYPDAYERLLMDVVRGNLTLFMRREEVETAWRWIDDIVAAWNGSGTTPELYAAGTDGPTSSVIMMDRDDRAWWNPNG